jgi:hypothetical protein
MTLTRLIAALILIGVCAHAQPGCPTVNFQAAITANLAPNASAQVTLVQQASGSYTAAPAREWELPGAPLMEIVDVK